MEIVKLSRWLCQQKDQHEQKQNYPVLQRGGFNAMIALRGAINHEMCIGEEVSLSPHYPPNLLDPPPKIRNVAFCYFLTSVFTHPLCFFFWQ